MHLPNSHIYFLEYSPTIKSISIIKVSKNLYHYHYYYYYYSTTTTTITIITSTLISISIITISYSYQILLSILITPHTLDL